MDGPLLPIEFARRSSDSRLTLVIADVPERVRSLWTLLDSADVEAARRGLGEREGAIENLERDIAFWSHSASSGHPEADVVGGWALQRQLDAVVWTALRPGLSGSAASVPTADAVVDFLRGLPGEKQALAEQYIRNAPLQIDTPYRRRIAKELGWTPSETAFAACGLTRRCG